MSKETRKRKAEHIRISLNMDTQARRVATGFDDVQLIHRAVPQINKEKINLKVEVFNHEFAAPIIVGAMTGGIPEAKKINAAIAEAVEELGLGMGVGSQRAAIEDGRFEETFAVARGKAPTAFLIANIGAVQLAQGYGIKEVQKAIEMIDADAVAVHLNALQEAIQPEGETNFEGVLEKLRELAGELDKPVIVKETGAGISAEDAEKLEKTGVKGIDVSGVGGTSFAAIEYYRAKRRRMSLQRKLGQVFWDWGIPTAVSIVEVSQTVKIPVVASGGIRSGAEIAKALTLGSSLAGISQPILKEAAKGTEKAKHALLTLVEELKTAMFLVGAESINALFEKPVVITGKTAEWLKLRGFDVEKYARRRGQN